MFRICMVVIVLAALISLTPAVQAFYTFRAWGGNVHEQMTRKALSKLGVCEANIVKIDKASENQDIPATAAFVLGANHFDDCEFKPSLDLVNQRFSDLNTHLQAARTSDKELDYVLARFGEILHAMQDFYSHSNYIELALKSNENATPSSVGLANFKGLPAGLKTGYFWYSNAAYNEGSVHRDVTINKLTAGKQMTPGTTYMLTPDYLKLKTLKARIDYINDAKYSIPHTDMNKDGPTTDEGKMVTAGGTSLHQFAVALATQETERQWNALIDVVKRNHPKDAAFLINRLKNRSPIENDPWSGQWIAQGYFPNATDCLDITKVNGQYRIQHLAQSKRVLTIHEINDKSLYLSEVVAREKVEYWLTITGPGKATGKTKVTGPGGTAEFVWNVIKR